MNQGEEEKEAFIIHLECPRWALSNSGGIKPSLPDHYLALTLILASDVYQ